MNKTKILLVDDDPNIRQLVSLYLLTREGFEVEEAQRGDDALKQFKAAAPNMILARHHAARHGRLASVPRGAQGVEHPDHHADRQG